MPEFTNAQWGVQFANTTVGAVFSTMGTLVSPIQILEDALSAYNKAETIFNNTASGPPYLNSVSNPAVGAPVMTSAGVPVVPIVYTVNVDKSFINSKVLPRESTIII